ncbi:hypothetical protein ILUMI_11235 [Ignelater luminosus]|uniref:Reverse transcriptase domain-containing protein n=1 Tax=Ignelater luminosus TaxID=2038154 RepID=A0A8K0CWL9_IGNLU|nr:hypothetical protein ILUMI_11235 [Ignelater luminosus]
MECARIDSRYKKRNLLQHIYDKATFNVELADDLKTSKISLNRGTRQGDTISFKLFSLVLELAFKNLNWNNKGININGRYLNHLRVANDTVLISNDPNKLQQRLRKLKVVSEDTGLTMNIEKTKAMTANEQEFRLDDNVIETVDSYIYLGHVITCRKGNQTTGSNEITTDDEASDHSQSSSDEDPFHHGDNKWSDKFYTPLDSTSKNSDDESTGNSQEDITNNEQVTVADNEERHTVIREEVETIGTLDEKVIKSLSKTVRNENVILAFDRFFTSVNLIDTIKYPAAGTEIPTRKDMPEKFSNKAKQKLAKDQCSHAELCNLQVDKVQDNGPILIATLNDTKTKRKRIFAVSPDCNRYELYKKYARLSKHGRRLFLYYKDNKYTSQAVGINTFAKAPQKIAGYLHLLDATSNTEH